MARKHILKDVHWSSPHHPRIILQSLCYKTSGYKILLTVKELKKKKNCEGTILGLLARTCHSYFYSTNFSSIKKLSFLSPASPHGVYWSSDCLNVSVKETYSLWDGDHVLSLLLIIFNHLTIFWHFPSGNVCTRDVAMEDEIAGGFFIFQRNEIPNALQAVS